jgi:hypothetical protein
MARVTLERVTKYYPGQAGAAVRALDLDVGEG